MANPKKLIFPNLPELERKELIARIVHAMTKSNESYYDGVRIAEDSERKGDCKDMKLFNINIHGNE